METSINLDLDDLIDPEDDFEDDDLPAVTRLPALDEDDDQENLLNTSGQRNEGLLDTLLDPAVEGEGGEAPAAKRVVNRKPIPKLDATRLTGDRGLPVLMKQFENVKFKGKGHEVSDLDRLMRVMEHWAHRLFPKMPFDDVIERIEKLGSKKSVQTCMRRIRLDMPLLDEDFVTRGGEDVIEGGDTQPATVLGDDFPASSFPGTQQPPSSINTPKVPMTDEQRERIERNKRLAMERKLNKQKEAQSSQMPAASQSGGLDEAELNDLFGMGGAAQKRVEDDDGIDSDEAEMEREMWKSQMMGGKKEEERGRKDEMKASQQRAAPEEMEIDPDEAEMEDEMWTQMTPSVATQSQSQETPKLSTKSKVVDDESDDDDEMKSTKDSQGGVSQKEVSTGARRSKRVIEDDSDDDDDDDVRETVKDSHMGASQKVPSRGAKKRRVIDDDDDESEDEMEKEDSNKMTKLLSPRPPKDNPDELSAPRSQTVSQKSKRNDNDGEEEYASKEGNDNEKDPKNAEDDIDICNQMTEPVLSQKPADSNTLLISQETSISSNLDKDTNEDTEETGSEIWNQMTEHVATQNVNDSQEDMLYTALKSKKSVIDDDDDDDEDDTQIDVDLCNQDTEPVATGDSQDTV